MMKRSAESADDMKVISAGGKRWITRVLIFACLILIGISTGIAHAGRRPMGNDISRVIMIGDFERCRMLMERKPDLLDPERGALYSASHNGRMRIAGYLISKGVDVNSHYCCGLTALHAAAFSGHVDMANLLLNNGADINAADESGWTPLHHAAHEDQIEMVKTLISAGADINKADRYHVSPLSLALIDEKKRMAEYLKKYGAVEALEGAGEILKAAEEDNVDKAEILLSRNAGLIDVRDWNLSTLLIVSSFYGSRKMVELLLNNGADINAKSKYYEPVPSAMTPLAWALFERDTDMAELLIRKGADPNEKSWHGITPLEWAIGGKDQEIVEMLISAGAHLNGRDSHAISEAISLDDISMVEYLLDKGTDVNGMNSIGNSPLDDAVSYGNRDIAKLLISRGADVNMKGELDRTPLYNAVINKNTEMIEYLVSKGADINAGDRDGRTPLDYAFIYSRDLSKTLEALGVDVKARTSRGETALFFADERKDAEYLIEKGIGVKIKDNEGRTALHGSGANRNIDVARVLVRHGADLNAKDNNGETPLHAAVYYRNDDLVQYLLEKGADSNIRDNEGRTPLHVAAARGESGMVKLLIAGGSDINARDGKGLTPLSLVLMCNNDEAAEYIRRHGGIEAEKGAGEIFCAVENADAARVGEILDMNPSSISGRNRRSCTPLLLAAESGWKNVVDVLISHGADIKARMKCSEWWDSGYTPLHMAVRWNYRIVAETLIESGADVNAEDDRGKTPLAIARDCGFTRMADMLRKHGAR
ncbi:MAG: ankyrin repeat domain-containing protein [Vulcanimicrobiota bacterium]